MLIENTGKKLKSLHEEIMIAPLKEQNKGASIAHIPVLDGVRAASILLVLAGHMLPLGPIPIGNYNFDTNHAAAVSGMSLFFILSGFLIASFLLARQDIVEFLVKRIGRIVPAVYVYLIFCYVLVSFEPKTLMVAATFTLNYLNSYSDPFNGYLWSLCVEMHFYLVAALIVFALGRRGLYLLPVLALVVTGLRIQGHIQLHIFTHLRLDEILAGCTLALVYREHNDLFQKARPWLARLFVPFVILWGLSSVRDLFPAVYVRPYAAGLVVASILAMRSNIVTYILESAPARYIALVSYALYIWHPATMQFGMSEGSTATRYLIKRPISIALTFLAAHLSTFYIEKPSSNFVRNFLTRRRARLEAASKIK